MENSIQFICQRNTPQREVFHVWDVDEFLIGEIRFDKATKDFHCFINKAWGLVFAQRHKSMSAAEQYFINRFNRFK